MSINHPLWVLVDICIYNFTSFQSPKDDSSRSVEADKRGIPFFGERLTGVFLRHVKGGPNWAQSRKLFTVPKTRCSTSQTRAMKTHPRGQSFSRAHTPHVASANAREIPLVSRRFDVPNLPNLPKHQDPKQTVKQHKQVACALRSLTCAQAC